MTEQEKRQIQAAAFTMAEHTHKNDAGIKELRAKIVALKEATAKHEEAMRNSQRDLNVEIMNLRKLLIPHIPEDLRD